ncbi:hypothetical protein NEOLEDRAFT_1146105 [Neolentinus lepideus HHB14362 ss-1]|uniref:DUF6533 domain-containing protein n=1 Tax=Neolentinus lepideus HHB14362 ss-1 TaxID=1314782 RepID=A0A165UFU1_9AGAM|nr:hypothetical protein NEOLEDRAFT_1146105 [Neolentinus lepideus HHB14362 ss-1]
MSSDFAAVLEAIHEARKAQVNRYANFSRLALMTYDIVLNLGREKQLVWDAKFRMYSMLYYMSRYPLVPFTIFEVFYTPTIPQHALTSAYYCTAIYRSTWAIALVPTRIAIVASFVLRVYAVTMAKSYTLVFLLTLAGIAVIVFDILQVADTSCTQSAYPIATLLTFVFLVVFDVLATVIISYRLYKVVREAGGLQRLTRQSMAGFIMRSGACILLPMMCRLFQGVYSQALNNYTLLISSILTSRFLLDLRSTALDRMPETSTDRFSTKVQSIKEQKSWRRWGLTVVQDFEGSDMSSPDGKSFGFTRPEELTRMEWPMDDMSGRSGTTGREEEETHTEEVKPV